MPDPHKPDTGRADIEPLKVLIAGGGVAGLEAAFALREFAGDRVAVTILAANDEFVYRPMSIAEPFTSGWAQHYPLTTLVDAAGAALIGDTLVEVDVTAQTVFTASGRELAYDALLICLGASVEPRYEHATTIDDAHMDELLHGLVQDIEGGYVQSLAVVVPTPVPWPFPAYELALMASERAWTMQTDLSITVLTPEKSPLEIFGADVSRELGQLLADRKIEVIPSAYCEIPANKTIRIHPGARSLEVDRIIALPQLRGPAVVGVPSDGGGFIAVNEYAGVKGVRRIWAAGDSTDFPIKHGGVAAQMADTAARSIAALAGAAVESVGFAPVLEGVLLTGGRPRYLRSKSTDAGGAPAEFRRLARDDHPPKIAARFLAPRLAAMTPDAPNSRSAISPVAAT
jgi:sulfide:quinone oxidoreductase